MLQTDELVGMKHCRNDTDRETRRSRRKICSSVILPTKKSHINLTGLVSNPTSVARGRPLVVRCLRYDLHVRYFEIWLYTHFRWLFVILVSDLDR